MTAYGFKDRFVDAIRANRKDVLCEFADSPYVTWRQAYRDGWRVVRIEIRVVK